MVAAHSSPHPGFTRWIGFLLVWLVRRGQAAKASSLMFLAPPLAALQAWFLFGDRLGTIQITGFAVALMGVVLCNWRWKVRV